MQGGPIYCSVDGALTWLLTNAPSAQWTAMSFDSRSNVVASSMNQGVYLGTYAASSNTIHWTLLNSMGGFRLTSIAASDGIHITAISQTAVYTLTNGGSSFSTSTSLPTAAYVYGGYFCVASDSSGKRLFVCYRDLDSSNQWASFIYTSNDFGTTWSKVLSLPTQDTYGNRGLWSSVACDNSGQYVVALNPTIKMLYVSSDYGVSWRSVSGIARSSGQVLSSSSGQIIACLTNGVGNIEKTITLDD